MLAAIDAGPIRILGGPSGAITGLGSLSFNGGGTLDPVPNWMRGGAQGIIAGWLTITATVPSLARLFYLSNTANTNVIDCYAEPASNRWQLISTSNSVARATCFINGVVPGAGTTIGFALGWRPSRVFGVIGVANGVGVNLSDSSLAPTGMTRMNVGNRFDGARPLPANFLALDYVDTFQDDAQVTYLAGRLMTAPQPRV